MQGGCRGTFVAQLAALENTLGVRLFEKVQGGKLLPTSAGARAISEAEQIEERLLALCDDIVGGNSEAAGTVRLTAVPILANHLLVPATRQLLDRYPELYVEIVADFRDLSLTKARSRHCGASRRTKEGYGRRRAGAQDRRVDVWCLRGLIA
jgi:DNA-binding transcriptional LysR family regulator